jgi:hypothetical protein
MESKRHMKRRQFFLFAMLVPLSLGLLRHFGVGDKYVEKNGWILKPEDL